MASDNKGSNPKNSANNKPAQRSSKKPRKPVTIDLEAAKVESNPVKKPATENLQKTAVNPSPKPEIKPSAASAVPSIKSNAPKPKMGSAVSGENKFDKNKPAEKAASGHTNKTSSSQEKPPAMSQTKKAENKPTLKPDQSKKVTTSDNSGGGLGKIFAGVFGGIIALVGAFLLQQFGVISSGNTNTTELSAKIIQIDQDLKVIGEKLDSSTQSGVKSLIARIDVLETSQQSSTAALANQSKTVEETSTKLSSAIAAAVAKAESLQQSISSGAAGENAALATLDERVKILETTAANVTDTVSGALEAELETVKKQLGELAESVASISTAGSSQSTERVAEVTIKFADISTKLAELAKVASDDQTVAAEKISSVESALGSLQDNLGTLSSRLEQVETIAATPRKDEQRVARALAVAGLKSAIDGGGNFESALALVQSLGTDTQATDPLKPFAANGVPTLSVLESAFFDLSDQIVKTATPVENTGAMDKFFSNIRSLVTIKTTGVVAGSDPQAIVSRIKHGLKISDLEMAIKEWGSLPDAAKAVSKDWSQKLKARQSANSLIENLLKQFMTGASGAGN